jgi:ABC-type Mn2+/Zn2+ transport system ATPase subunit
MKITLVLISHDIGVVTKNANKVGCVNVSLTMHKIDGGEGIENVMACAYNPDFWRVPHHHH